MEIIVILTIVYSIVLTILYANKINENDRNYSNYQNCLKALANTDDSLKDYLERRCNK